MRSPHFTINSQQSNEMQWNESDQGIYVCNPSPTQIADAVENNYVSDVTVPTMGSVDNGKYWTIQNERTYHFTTFSHTWSEN